MNEELRNQYEADIHVLVYMVYSIIIVIFIDFPLKLLKGNDCMTVQKSWET